MSDQNQNFDMKRSWDERQEVLLPPSVESKLQKICESHNKPRPEAGVIKQLAAQSEESGKEILDKISMSQSIRNLGGYIMYMIRQCSSTSSPSPSKTVRSGHVLSPGGSSLTPRRLQFGPSEQPGSCCRSSVAHVSHVQVDERFRGEAVVSDRPPVVGHLPCCAGSPWKGAASCSYQRLSNQAHFDEMSQVEAFEQPSPVIEQSLYYSASPLDAAGTSSQRLSALVQLGDKFHGEPLPYSCGSPWKATGSCACQRLSNHAQVDERSQGEAFNHLSPVIGQSLYSSGSPLEAPGSSSQRLSAPVQLGELFIVLEQQRNNMNGESPYYCSGLPFKVARTSSSQSPSASVARVQLEKRFQDGVFTDQTHSQGQSLYASGSASNPVCISPYQRPSTDVIPVQLHECFQGEGITRPSVIDRAEGHGEAHLEALGELEYRKQFLILSYAGVMKLKDLIAVEDIRHWKDLPMVTFESTVWEYLGRKCISTEDRRLGPYLYKIRRTLLQKELGDDNVLMVKFAKDEVQRSTGDHNYSTYMTVAREGILVGLRRYRFFVFKDGGNEEKKKNPTSSPVKCYFVRVASDAAIDKGVFYKLSNRTMHEARCLFMHAHTLPSIDNYMARFSLILSKTTSLKVDWSLVMVEHIEEEYCLDESGNHIYRDEKPLIHTDGTGFISEDLALRCPKIEAKGQWISEEHMKGLPDHDELEDNDMGKNRPCLRAEEPPLLIQCRFFHNGSASKGTFLVNKKLQPSRIQIRPSMLKVKTDPAISNNQSLNSLEIVGTSAPPRNTHLSRILIALLMHGGVPEEFFMQILNKALEDAHGVFSKKRPALKVAEKYGEIDDNFLAKLMISFGIPLEESYLRYRLSVLMKEENTSLRKGRLFIPDSYNLMGTADPTGTLKKDEVCVILKDGQLSGKVLVYRYPGLHFGDVHVLKATYVKELESFVGNAKYGIFFSCKGPRSIADEMGGGDFDGDLYWVSRNPQLLEWYKPSAPWIETSVSTKKDPSRSPSDHSPEDLEDVLFRSFLTNRFEPSFAMSEAADNWLAWMDRFLTLGDSNMDQKNDVKNKILKLVDLYYTALDAPKKGVKVVIPKELKVPCFPHYLGKTKSYPSTSVLGLIYNRVDEYQTEERSLREVEKLPAFDEREVPDACLDKWGELYREYRKEMASAMTDDDKQSKNQSADVVIRKYKTKLYEANDFEESRRPIEEIYNEAHAIYHVCYDHAKRKGSVQACSFAWRVAELEQKLEIRHVCSFKQKLEFLVRSGRALHFILPHMKRTKEISYPQYPLAYYGKTPKRPIELSNEDLEDELIKLFLKTRFEPSFAMNEAAENWIALMDKYLTSGDKSIDEKNELKGKILQLVDIYYEALDAPKQGLKVVVPKELKAREFPHFMEKKKQKSYHSSSILGSIYDKVEEYETVYSSLQVIRKLPVFDVNVPENCLKDWEKHYEEYRYEMASALGDEDKHGKNQAANLVIKKYKKILYKAEEFEQSSVSDRQQIYTEALAIYHVCYDYAKSVRTENGAEDVGKCGFAWKVAGAALCQLHEDSSLQPGEKIFRVLPSVLKDIL